MSDHIIIGGGFAGLSAAAYLSSRGKKVELIEASQKLGGRAYSFTDKTNNTVIDNGQHILMGCYRETIDFFRLIGAEENLVFQDRLEVNFVLPHYHVVPLRSASRLYPLNLTAGLLSYKAISAGERLLLLKFFLMLPLYSDNDLRKMTVYEWLHQEHQNENIIKAFWEILTVGALNTSIYKASAMVLKDILFEIFFRGNKASTIVLPGKGLTESYCNHAKEYIESRGGKISTGEQANKLLTEDSRIRTIITNRRVLKNFNSVIAAVPFHGLKRFTPAENIISDPGLRYSSILNVHIWLKVNRLKEKFYGLVDSQIHWIFNHGTHLTIVRSDADNLMEKSREEIFEIVKKELFRYFFIEGEDIKDYRIIKEKRATFIPSNDILNKRPGAVTNLSNLFLAGDWTDTDLPSTIESAVKSGRMAAEHLL
jgi:squalene-associated FAD-dependent desaturase